MSSRQLLLQIHVPTASKPLELRVTSESSIADVKTLIGDNLPQHPLPADQRLVYAGLLLSSDAKLSQVLRRNEQDEFSDKYVFHLALSAKYFNDNVQKDAKKSEEPMKTSADPTNSNNNASLPNDNHDNGHLSASSPFLQSGHGQHGYHGSHHHQWYMYYMYHYMQHHQQQQQEQHYANGGQVAVNAPVATAPFVPGNMGLNNAAEVVEEEVAQEEHDVDENNGQPRDMLDWFYISTRLVVLFSVVYFYSSLARFALVAGLAVVVALWNAGQARQHQQQQQQQLLQQQRDQQQQQRQEGDEGEVAEADEQNGREEVTEQVVNPPNEAHSSLNVAATFFTTLFMSLLPQQPQVV